MESHALDLYVFYLHGLLLLNPVRNDRGLTRHEMRSILMRNGVILNFFGFLNVIGPIVSVSSVQP